MLVWALVALLRLRAGNAEPIAGPYRITWDRTEPCPPELLDFPFVLHAKSVRSRQNFNVWIINANATIDVPFGDHLSGILDVSSWSSRGGWKPHALVMRFQRVCNALGTYIPQTFHSFLEATTGDPKAKCPVPAGVYLFPNVTTSLDVKHIRHFFYGKWRVDVKAVYPKSGRCMACGRLHVQTVPRIEPPRP